jgi:hypothetical protein
VRFLRRGEPTPDGYDEADPIEARAALRPALGSGDGVWLAGPGRFVSASGTPRDRGPLWRRLKEAWTST